MKRYKEILMGLHNRTIYKKILEVMNTESSWFVPEAERFIKL